MPSLYLTLTLLVSIPVTTAKPHFEEVYKEVIKICQKQLTMVKKPNGLFF